MPTAVVQLQLQTSAGPQLAGTAAGFKSVSAEQARAEAGALRYATAVQRLTLAQARVATESQRYAIQTANVARAQSQAESAALRLSTAQTRVASSSSYGAQTADAFKSGLAGIVGPAALVAGGLALLAGTAQSFKEAFAFNTQLDLMTRSIASQLKGVTDSSIVFAEATEFANRYKLTQAEMASTLQSSIGVLRNTSSSTTELLETLSLLQATAPEKPISEAARALRELASGDVTTIKELFNISAGAAQKMKNEIAKGGDAVQVLAKYLKDANVSMDLLENGATGAAGATRDLARAQEELKIAQGEIASSGLGIAVVNAASTAWHGLANLVKGDVTSGFRAHLVNVTASAIGMAAYTQAINEGKNAYEAAEAAQRAYNAAIAAAEEPTVTATGAYNAAALAATYYAGRLLGLEQQANLTSAALAGVAGAAPNTGKHLNDRSGGAVGGLGDTLTKAGNVAAQVAKKTDAEAARLQQARDNLALARATTSAQKIAELKRQQARTSDPVEKLQLQAQIEQERNSGAKAHTGELGKQLKLNEGIYDSVEKQRDALLDIEELAIRDRQQDRADVQKRKTALAILASPNASADMKGRAADALALIDVQDRKRANELASKTATAGGSIIGGKLYQSAPGGALPVAPGNLAPGALPSPGGAADGVSGAAAMPLTINLVCDGKILASVTEQHIMDSLMAAVRGSRATAGA